MMTSHYDTDVLMLADIVGKQQYGMTIYIYWNMEIETYASFVEIDQGATLGPFYGYSPTYWRMAGEQEIRDAMLGEELFMTNM